MTRNLALNVSFFQRQIYCLEQGTDRVSSKRHSRILADRQQILNDLLRERNPLLPSLSFLYEFQLSGRINFVDAPGFTYPFDFIDVAC